MTAVAALMALWISTGAGLHLYERHALAQLKLQSGTLAAELEVLGKQIAERRPDASLAAHVVELEGELDAKRRLSTALDGRALGNTSGFSPLLTGLALGRVDGVWMQSIHVRDGGDHVALGGHTLSAERVPDLLARLGEQPAYTGRVFARLSLELDEDEGAIRFDLDTRDGDGS